MRNSLTPTLPLLFLISILGCQSSYRSDPIPLYHSLAVDTSLTLFQSQLQCLQQYIHHGVTLVVLINDFQAPSQLPPSLLQQHIHLLKEQKIPYFLLFTSLHQDSLLREFSGCDTFVQRYFKVLRTYIAGIPEGYPPRGIVLGDRWYELDPCESQITKQVEQLKSDFPGYQYSWLQSLHWWEKNKDLAPYDFIALEYPDPPVRRPENAVPFLNQVIQRKLTPLNKPVWIGRFILMGKHAQAKWKKLQTKWDAQFPLIGVNLFTIFPYFNVCDTLSPLQLHAPWLEKNENPHHSP